MTLKARLAARIRADGPIPVSDYMSACLFDREFGYYNRADAIGQRGAFTTAPEISQMFGELIGVFLAQSWADQGRPSPFTVAELGPGRGTMMSDILRAASKLDGFRESAQLVLLESSPALRDAQRNALSGHDPIWIEHIGNLPDRPLFLAANEFFDALPIRQFRRTESGWNEIRVGLGPGGLEFQDVFCSDAAAPRSRGHDTMEGDIVEIRPAAASIARVISRIVGKFGGAALLVDYGGEKSLGNTLQAVKDHAYICALAEPGKADISAHIDFGEIRTAADGSACAGPLPQGVWLERMGITERARVLAREMEGGTLRQHTAGCRRLIHPDEMGSLFKVMALYPRGAPLPPGFAA